MKEIVYKGFTIEINQRGLYYTFLPYAGRFCQADTLKAIKDAINRDILNTKLFSNHD